MSIVIHPWGGICVLELDIIGQKKCVCQALYDLLQSNLYMYLYNTLSRSIEEFRPINPPNVGMYTCGPTVYREIHIGNFRTYITADILRRVLKFNGYHVASVMNITDVGHMRTTSVMASNQIDPILEEAKALGVEPLKLAERYTDVFLKDAKRLNIVVPDSMPKATEHIPDMIELIKVLIEKGFAYETGGNVYFKVKKFKQYGKLSGNTLDKMDQLLEAVRVSLETDKKDSVDFALWKRAEKDRLMQWNSPWGRGFPGWHIECSAMSTKYLGKHFDIHVGGEDLMFPHHEDEIAQSEAAFGETFVNYWVHSNWLLVDGEKMSKSKRNVYILSDIEKKRVRPLALRYLTFLTHYRARMNFTWKALSAAEDALSRMYELAASFDSPKIGCAEFEEKFLNAVSNDLDMPKAISVMWELLRSDYPTSAKAESLYKMDEVLGLKIHEHIEASKNIPAHIFELVQKRDSLRRERKYGQSDQLRARIEKMGYVIEDAKKGTKILRKITVR